MKHRTPRRSRPHPPVRSDRGEIMLFLCALAFVSACLLLNGGPVEWGASLLVVAVPGTAMLVLTILRGGLERLHALPWDARAALLLIALAAPLQLLPLPPLLWQALPGRTFAVELLASVGIAGRWHPLTLDVDDTLLTGAVTLWMLGLFAAMLTLGAQRMRHMAMLILAITGLHLLVGSIQVISHGSTLLFYPSTHNGFLTGLFANKNHSGLFIAVAMVLGLWLIPAERLGDRTTLLYVVPLLLLGLLMEFATNSRAGLLLACVGVVGMIASHLRRMRRRHRRNAALLASGIALIGLALWSTPLVGRLLGRFSFIQSDLRLELWARTLPMIRATFPAGAGFGIFPQLYATRERIEWVSATYANHAHNDYLELVLETGMLGIAILMFVFLALVRAGAWGWATRTTSQGRQATTGIIVAVLVLAHSTVDYPLRRLGLAAVFVLALAMLFAPRLRDEVGAGDSDCEPEASR